MIDVRGNDVLVDLDNVLTDFDGGVQNTLALEYPAIPIAARRVNYFIPQDYPEHQSLVRAIYCRPGFLRELAVLEGAIEGWQKLLNLGYIPRVCSSPLPGFPECKQEKLDWLDEHFAPVFGKWVVDTAIIDREKYRYDALALIDDRPEVKGSSSASWEHIVFSQPFNQNSSARFRLNGWQDPNLETILATIKHGPS